MRIPQLLKARYVKAFARAHDEMGLSPQRSLAKAKLNEKALSDAENWIPVSQLGNFVTASVQQNGCRELGLVAGMLPRRQHSAFSRKSLLQPTLHQSLMTICRNSHMEDTSASFRLIKGDETTRLNCGSISGSSEWVRQLEFYRLGALLQVIRTAAGEDWLPPMVNLQSDEDGKPVSVQFLQGMDIRFGCGEMSIVIPTNLLSRSPRGISNADIAVSYSNTDQQLMGPSDFMGTVGLVIRNQLGHRPIGISQVADCMGIATRSLQRQLSIQGTTYSKILEQVRIKSACEMLIDTDISQQDIAKELGYRHQTHFSRAFRRVCGMSPGQYRSIETSE